MRRARRPLSRWLAVAALAAAAACAVARPVAARQRDLTDARHGRVSGEVVDRESGKAVSAARIQLLARLPGASSRSADTDSLGAFSFERVEAGSYSLRVERLGYRDLVDSLRVPGGGETLVTVSIVPAVLDLEPLVVTAVRRTPYFMRDFERRRALGIGRFVTRADIEAQRPLVTSDLFRMVPGFRVVPGSQVRGAQLVMRGSCRPRVYIDGMATFEGLSIDLVVRPEDIEAIEVYSTAGVPAPYIGSSCGVVLVWTRVGEPVRGGSFWRRVLVVGGLVLAGVIITR